MCPVGIWTVGWGRALRDIKTGRFLMGDEDKAAAYEQYQNTTEAHADFMLAEDLKIFASSVDRLVSIKLSPCQFGAIVSFTYNVGVGSFEGSTIRKMLNSGNIEEASQQFARWNKSRGKVLPGLTIRREAERKLFTTGIFP